MNAARTTPVPWLAIFGLWALAVAQPLLDLIARNPEFLVAHRAGRSEILLLVACLVLPAPAVLTGFVWFAGLAGRRSRSIAAGLVLGGLAGLIGMQVATRAGVGTWKVAVPMAALAGALTAVAHARVGAVRLFAAVVGIATIVTPALFLTRPQVRRALAADTSSKPANVAARVSPPSGSPADTPVVILVMDELPLLSLLDADRRIDPVLYPNLAALARDGSWYRNATTVSDYTRWAVPVIVTGQYPDPNLVPRASDYPDTLFTLLGQTHRLEVVEAASQLCPQYLCAEGNESGADRARVMASDLTVIFQHVLLTRDLKAGLPDLNSNWAGFAVPETPQQRRQRRLREQGRRDKRRIAFAMVDGVSSRDPQPTFYFLHSLLPHFPYLHLPDGKRNATRIAIPGEIREQMSWNLDEWGVIQNYQRHLMEMRVVDATVGRMLQRLREVGIYDEALVVVTSDHGSSYRPGAPRRNFTEATAAEIMRIPLIIKYPSGVSVPGQVSDRNVESIDIAPTVAGALGLALPWKADGVSLLKSNVPERSSKTIYFASAQQSRTYPRDGPDVWPPLRRKLEVFGSRENPYLVPRSPRFANLVGRSLGDLRVQNGGPRVEVKDARRFQELTVDAEEVPFDLGGALEGQRRSGAPVFVAVAVNGTVRAVTRTWDTEPRRWLATPPLDVWHQGRNDLQVFVVEEDERGPVLRRATIVP